VSVVVIGLNHRTAPLELLERMTVSDAALPKALHDLVTRQHLLEATVLSTCNRTEVYAVADKFHGAYSDIRNFLADSADLAPEAFGNHLYVHYDEAAVAHLFEVAAGLDSAVLGESEILGQVGDAWHRAQREGAAGAVLNLLFRHALEVGKRARSETGIGRHIASVSQAAVAMARDRIGELAGRRVLVLGAGEMGEGMASALAGAGVAEVLVANRTWANAVALAERTGGRAVRLTDLAALLVDVDLLLTSTGASALMLDRTDLDAIVARRDGRTLLIVDIAVPRDIDPEAATLPGVTLLDMDDLRDFAETGIERRRREIARVRHIVEDELDRYLGLATAREVAPLVAELRERAEEIRTGELDRNRKRLADLDPAERAAVDALTKAVLAKLLHEPTVRLKDAAGTPRGERLADAVRDLFDLGELGDH
jgi:glutamyl-tRNA reductase